MTVQIMPKNIQEEKNFSGNNKLKVMKLQLIFQLYTLKPPIKLSNLYLKLVENNKLTPMFNYIELFKEKLNIYIKIIISMISYGLHLLL